MRSLPIRWRSTAPDGTPYEWTRKPENEKAVEIAWGDDAGKWQVHHGDCLDVMRSMPAASVDAVVTDPPYGLDFRGASWDAFIPDWLGEARRVSRGPVVFTTAPTTLWDYPRPDWVLCWERPGSTGRRPGGGFCHWSPVLVYGAGSWNPDCYRLAAALAGNDNLGIDHPSPKPVGLMRWLVRGAAKVGATILDPFCGSGTTGVSCVEEGYSFLGVDENPAYVAIARARIEAAARAPMLDFGPTA